MIQPWPWLVKLNPGARASAGILTCFVENIPLLTPEVLLLHWYNSLYSIVPWVLTVKLLSGECLPQKLTNEKSTLVLVMACSRNVTTHYTGQSWSIFRHFASLNHNELKFCENRLITTCKLKLFYLYIIFCALAMALLWRWFSLGLYAAWMKWVFWGQLAWWCLAFVFSYMVTVRGPRRVPGTRAVA